MRKQLIRTKTALLTVLILLFETSSPWHYSAFASEMTVSSNVAETEESADTVSGGAISENNSAVSSEDAGQTEVSSDSVSSASVSEPEAGYDPLKDIKYTYDDSAREDDVTIGVPEQTMSLFSLEAAGEDMPISYNSMDEGYVTPAKNQGESGLCWAHSVCSLAETSMIMKGYATKDSVNYSEDQLGYFFYNRIADPLGGTTGDSNKALIASYYSGSQGGNNLFTTFDLASWISTRNDAEDPLPSSAHSSLSDDLAYSSMAHLENAIWISTVASDTDISYTADIKKAVKQYGSVTVNVSSLLGINGNHASYKNVSGSAGHNVTIIGWDDSFVSGNFSTRPVADGAWIIKDSYGTDGNRDARGCFYMSYYDKVLTKSGAEAIAYDFGKSDNYRNNYQYDGACGIYYISAQGTGKPVYGKNIFTASAYNGTGEIIRAVSFATRSTNTDYQADIYLIDSPSDKLSSANKVAAAETTGSTTYEGYYTVKLNQPVTVSEGQMYAAVIRLVSAAGTARLGRDYSYKNSSWVTFTGASKPQQGYFSYGGTSWTDGSTSGLGTPRIKAFTDNISVALSECEIVSADRIYDGTEHKAIVKCGRNTLKEGIDYTAVYSGDTVNPGHVTATITGINDFTGTVSEEYSIVPVTVQVSLDQTQMKYTGSEYRPGLKLSSNSLMPQQGVDYTFDYSNNINAGTGTVTVSVNNSNFAFDRTSLSFNIAKRRLNVSYNGAAYTYDGKECRPGVTVSADTGQALKEGTDYTVSYDGNLVDAGKKEISVSVDLANNDVINGKYIYTIAQRDINEFKIQNYIPPQQYASGNSIEPELDPIRDTYTGKDLVRGKDISVSYSNNRKQGVATVSVAGIGNYKGESVLRFTVTGISADAYPFTIKRIAAQTYFPGREQRPSLKVYAGGALLSEGADYEAEYDSNIDTGQAAVKVTGVAGTVYDASVSQADYTIKPMNINKATVEGIGSMQYISGRTYSVSPVLRVSDPITKASVRLREGIDYTVSYPNGNTGTKADQVIKVRINGINNFTGYITRSFRLVPKIPLSDASSISVNLSFYSAAYSGKKQRPAVSVTDISSGVPVTLSEDIDYKLSYGNNKDAGRGYVKITAINHRNAVYTGSVKAYFDITGAALSGCYTQRILSAFTYCGKARKPGIRLYGADGKRISAMYYYVVYDNNVNAGTASYTVYGRRRYSGVLASGTFEIKKRSYKSLSIRHVINRANSTDKVYVRYGKLVLREGEGFDYTLSGTADEKGRYAVNVLDTCTNFTEGTRLYR